MSTKHPGTAAVLSFVLPGLGQIYNGQFLAAVVWLIITPGFWLGTGGFFGWIAHVAASWFAYRYAKRIEYQQRLIDRGARETLSVL